MRNIDRRNHVYVGKFQLSSSDWLTCYLCLYFCRSVLLFLCFYSVSGSTNCPPEDLGTRAKLTQTKTKTKTKTIKSCNNSKTSHCQIQIHPKLPYSHYHTISKTTVTLVPAGSAHLPLVSIWESFLVPGHVPGPQYQKALETPTIPTFHPWKTSWNHPLLLVRSVRPFRPFRFPFPEKYL